MPISSAVQSPTKLRQNQTVLASVKENRKFSLEGNPDYLHVTFLELSDSSIPRPNLEVARNEF
jgi:hypothetical protein